MVSPYRPRTPTPTLISTDARHENDCTVENTCQPTPPSRAISAVHDEKLPLQTHSHPHISPSSILFLCSLILLRSVSAVLFFLSFPPSILDELTINQPISRFKHNLIRKYNGQSELCDLNCQPLNTAPARTCHHFRVQALLSPSPTILSFEQQRWAFSISILNLRFS